MNRRGRIGKAGTGLPGAGSTGSQSGNDWIQISRRVAIHSRVCVKPAGRANIIIQTVIGLNGSRGNISTRSKVQPISICRVLKSPLGDCLGIDGLNSQQRGERAQKQNNCFFHTLVPYMIYVANNLIFRTANNKKQAGKQGKKQTILIQKQADLHWKTEKRREKATFARRFRCRAFRVLVSKPAPSNRTTPAVNPAWRHPRP